MGLAIWAMTRPGDPRDSAEAGRPSNAVPEVKAGRPNLPSKPPVKQPLPPQKTEAKSAAAQPPSWGTVVTISASADRGYVVGPVQRGTTLRLQYEEGKWKTHGRKATNSPDDQSRAEDDPNHLAIANAPGRTVRATFFRSCPGAPRRRYLFGAPIATMKTSCCESAIAAGLAGRAR